MAERERQEAEAAREAVERARMTAEELRLVAERERAEAEAARLKLEAEQAEAAAAAAWEAAQPEVAELRRQIVEFEHERARHVSVRRKQRGRPAQL
eukprot:COSAG01_NODE_31837_length_590_cov_3.586558_1_plen_95_part_10